MANTKVSQLPSLNTVDSTTIFLTSSNTTGTETSYQASIGNVSKAILSNLTISDQTITGTTANANIILTPNGTGYVSVPRLALPVGSLVEETIPIIPIIGNVLLNQILEFSTSNVGLVPPAYGITIGIPAPWAVLELTADPAPVLEINDVLSGPGIPIPSAATFIGSGGFANVVITNKTFDGLPLPLPGFGTDIAITREVTLASLAMSTIANTNVALTPGAGGAVVVDGSILPYVDNLYTLGSPQKRFSRAYFGPGTIYLLDDILGLDLTLSATNGNLLVGGGSGLSVGKFNLFGNIITLDSPTEDFFIGNVGSTGNLTVNRRFNVENSTGDWKLFDINQLTGTTTLISNVVVNSNKAAFEIIGSTSRDINSPNNFGVLLHTSGTSDYPSRIYNDSYGNGTTKYSAYIGRHARGSALTPTQTLAGDIISRVGANPFTDNGFSPISTSRIDFVNIEDQTTTAQGGQIEFWNTPVGSNLITQVAAVTGTDLVFKPAANRGITFSDNTRQITAFNASAAVTYITAGSGLSGGGTGNVALNATGVQNVVSYSNNQIIITDAGSKNLTLSLPQDININSSVTFSNVTVTGNLNVEGNTITANNLIILDKVIYLANTATSNTAINQGGIVLGNVSESWSRSILYDLSNDRWDTDGTGLKTLDLTAGNVYVSNLHANGTAHFGEAAVTIEYPNATIQADSDINSYSQIVSVNHSSGTDASTDYIAVNNIGNDSTNYIDLGINSSTYSNAQYGVNGPNDGYLYINGGNLVVGTQTAGKVVNFFTGGTANTTFIRANITDTGLNVFGNVSAQNANLGNATTSNYFIGNGYYLTGIRGANVAGAVAYATTANSVAGANVSGAVNLATYATTANVVAGANVSGAVGLATYATQANAVAGANVSGTVANATYAVSSGSVTNALTVNNSGTGAASGATFNGGSAITISYNTVGAPKADGTGASGTWGISISGSSASSNSVAGANVSGAVAYATTANAVAGANVSGAVNLATYATTANAVAGANVSGAVNLATYATTANSVAGANVSGTVANANYAAYAGNVTIAGQANITSVGTLTSLTIAAGNTTVNPLTFTAGPLRTVPQVGGFAYDGVTAYFTPSDQQRGIIPAIQVFIPNANVAYSNTTSNQSMFGLTNGVGVTANTKYMYRICGTVRKSSTVTAAMQYSIAVNGGATIQRHYYLVNPCGNAAQTAVTNASMMSNYLTSGFGTAVTVTNSITSSAGFYNFIIDGEIEILTSGQINPQVGFTGAPGTSAYIEAGSSMQIWPVGNITGNTSVGNWS